MVIGGGGEPLLHPEAGAICAAIKRRSWRGTLVTNGTLLHGALTEELVAIGWDTVRVSVHAGDAHTDRAVQGVDAFDVLRRNLTAFERQRRAARAERLSRLVVYHVLQPGNVEAVERLVELTVDVGADEVVVEVVRPLDETLLLTEAQIADAMGRLVVAAHRAPIPVSLPRNPVPGSVPTPAPPSGVAAPPAAPAGPLPAPPGRRCVIGFEQAFVDSFGWVKPCCYATEKLGNVRDEPFAAAWRGPAYASFRRRLVDGRFADYCRGCTLATVLAY
ncbi:MAG: SPASM domain-containing protein [bacterium]|nr:SPASM domain-containing protein [bacterium]